LGWLAIWFLFFFVLEGRVLCSHCPYWAKESRVLHCHANYGVIKLSKERLRPLHQLFLPVQRRSQAVGRRLSAAKPGHAEGVGSQRLSPGGVNGDLSPRGRAVLGLTAGSGLGTVAGLIGRGGGSVVVPLLYIAGLEARNAAATSAFVVTCSGTSSFISHLATAAQPQWGIWIATVLAVLLGSQFGSRLMAGRLKSRAVKQVFGWVLLGVAALIVVKDVILA
jgi:hypothetical protein